MCGLRYDSHLVSLSLVFHSSFMQCYPLGSNYFVGMVLSIGLSIYLYTLAVSPSLGGS